MHDAVRVFAEPPLEFRYGQAVTDPHDGLAMFGPFDTDMPSHPRNISYGLIGTSRGIQAFAGWGRLIQAPILTDPGLDERLWPFFPGFEAAFACSWPADMFDEYDPSIYQFSVDYRRQIKARSMTFGIPIQIVRESTLRQVAAATAAERQLTPLCDRAWNLGIALYYKAGGKPWRLSTAREGVCYIGLAYRRKDPSSSSPVACCAAQMFLDTGDGIVFMGEYGPWYSPERNAFHLERNAARRLLEGVLRTYRDLEGQPLREIFLHCRSGINQEEFAGFREACPDGVRLVGVRVRQERSDVRLFREGTRPVLRGTFWQVDDRTGYLWASGFKPRLRTYDGWETPVPLRIDVQHGEADIEQVAADILGLTKLNYNACKLGDAEPVTVGFSDAVGEILVSNPTVTDRRPNFKFYI